MCCSHTADTSAFDLDGCELKTPVCAVPAIHSPFFGTCWSESRLEISAQRFLSTSKMAALPGWSPTIYHLTLLWGVAVRPLRSPTHLRSTSNASQHHTAARVSVGPSRWHDNKSHRSRMRNSAWCVCVIITRSSYREGKKRGQRDAGGIAGLRIHRIMKQHLCVKTDQARASRGCRTSPAPAARGPRSSPRWCRCGRWSGTAATPTPAPSAAPHSGGTRRRSRPRYRLRWPGRPPRPRIKLPTTTVSFWRVLVSLSPVCLCVPASLISVLQPRFRL